MQKLKTILECGRYIYDYVEGNTTSAINFLKIDCKITELTWTSSKQDYMIYFDYGKNHLGSCNNKNASFIIEQVAMHCSDEERQRIIDEVNNIRDRKIEEKFIEAQINALASDNININNEIKSEIFSNLESTVSNINKNKNSNNIDIDNIFNKLIEEADKIDNNEYIIRLINEMKERVNKPTFIEKYKEFINLAAVHMSVFAPFLPALTSFI